jgi:phosphoglycerate dehydrogenase-like enzyme
MLSRDRHRTEFPMKAIVYPYGPEEPIIALTKDFPQLDWSVVLSPTDLATEIGDASIMVTSNRVCTPTCGKILRDNAASLRWIHFGSSGIERGIEMGLPDGIMVTNSTGVKATMVSEHAVTLLLALLRQLPEVIAHQRLHRYTREETNAKLRTLENATVCVVGRGAIAREIVRKVKAFDALPIAVSRTTSDADEVEAVYPREHIKQAFARSDAVVIATSGDETSYHLVGADELAALPSKAVIVNVARGNIIDEPALIAALSEGRLAGAGLDVQEEEPLPEDSPLWDMPNVITSPHIAGGGSTGYPMQKKLFAQNLERFRAGQPLINLCKIPTQV